MSTSSSTRTPAQPDRAGGGQVTSGPGGSATSSAGPPSHAPSHNGVREPTHAPSASAAPALQRRAERTERPPASYQGSGSNQHHHGNNGASGYHGVHRGRSYAGSSHPYNRPGDRYGRFDSRTDGQNRHDNRHDRHDSRYDSRYDNRYDNNRYDSRRKQKPYYRERDRDRGREYRDRDRDRDRNRDRDRDFRDSRDPRDPRNPRSRARYDRQGPGQTDSLYDLYSERTERPTDGPPRQIPKGPRGYAPSDGPNVADRNRRPSYDSRRYDDRAWDRSDYPDRRRESDRRPEPESRSDLERRPEIERKPRPGRRSDSDRTPEPERKAPLAAKGDESEFKRPALPSPSHDKRQSEQDGGIPKRIKSDTSDAAESSSREQNGKVKEAPVIVNDARQLSQDNDIPVASSSVESVGPVAATKSAAPESTESNEAAEPDSETHTAEAASVQAQTEKASDAMPASAPVIGPLLEQSDGPNTEPTVEPVTESATDAALDTIAEPIVAATGIIELEGPENSERPDDAEEPEKPDEPDERAADLKLASEPHAPELPLEEEEKRSEPEESEGRLEPVQSEANLSTAIEEPLDIDLDEADKTDSDSDKTETPESSAPAADAADMEVDMDTSSKVESVTVNQEVNGESAAEKEAVVEAEVKSAGPTVIAVPLPEYTRTPQEIENAAHIAARVEELEQGLAEANLPFLKPLVAERTFRVDKIPLAAARRVVAHISKLEEDALSRSRKWKKLDQRWQLLVRKLDTEAAEEAAAATAAAAQAAQQASSSPARGEPAVQAHHVSRRGTRGSQFADVARSEEEFLEILANLEMQSYRDPLVRARQTSAVIPLQRQLPLSETPRYIDKNDEVVDKASLALRLQTDGVDNFSPAEHELFCEAYVQSPKEFGRIAEVMNCGRTFHECVMHYYRTKKEVNYKQLVLKRRAKAKRGRKKKTIGAKESRTATPPPAAEELIETVTAPPELAASGEPAAVAEIPIPAPVPIPVSVPLPASASVSVPINDPVTNPVTTSGQIPAPIVPPARVSEALPTPIESVAVEATAQTPRQAPDKVSVTDMPAVPNVTEINEIPISEASATTPTKSEQVSGVLKAERMPTVILSDASRHHEPQQEPAPPQKPMDTLATLAVVDSDISTNEERVLDTLLGLYGTRFDEIARHLGKQAEIVRAFYLKYESKYAPIVTKADGVNARSGTLPVYVPRSDPDKKLVGPSLGVFPSRRRKDAPRPRRTTFPNVLSPQPQPGPIQVPTHVEAPTRAPVQFPVQAVSQIPTQASAQSPLQAHVHTPPQASVQASIEPPSQTSLAQASAQAQIQQVQQQYQPQQVPVQQFRPVLVHQYQTAYQPGFQQQYQSAYQPPYQPASEPTYQRATAAPRHFVNKAALEFMVDPPRPVVKPRSGVFTGVVADSKPRLPNLPPRPLRLFEQGAYSYYDYPFDRYRESNERHH